jgi:hypothetical protein
MRKIKIKTGRFHPSLIIPHNRFLLGDLLITDRLH